MYEYLMILKNIKNCVILVVVFIWVFLCFKIEDKWYIVNYIFFWKWNNGEWCLFINVLCCKILLIMWDFDMLINNFENL